MVSRPTLPSAAATCPAALPARTRTEAWTTLPVADPPGSTQLDARPASWALPTAGQGVPGSSMCTRTQRHDPGAHLEDEEDHEPLGLDVAQLRPLAEQRDTLGATT